MLTTSTAAKPIKLQSSKKFTNSATAASSQTAQDTTVVKATGNATRRYRKSHQQSAAAGSGNFPRWQTLLPKKESFSSTSAGQCSSRLKQQDAGADKSTSSTSVVGAGKAYLTRPLSGYRVVASVDMTQHPNCNAVNGALEPVMISPLSTAPRLPPPSKSLIVRQSIRRRKSPHPRRQLEALLESDNRPVPTLGRQSLADADMEVNLMRWQHLCLVCQRCQPSASQLFAHLLAHNLAMQRASRRLLGDSVRCCLCLELLPTWKRLRTHLQRHTGYQPFRCRQCAETFSTNGNLKRHIGRKHADKNA